MSRSLVVALSALAVAASPAAAAGPGQDRPAAERFAQQVNDLINGADGKVRKRHAECRPRLGPSTDVEVTPGPITSPFTDVLAMFRRPPTAAELQLAARTDRMLPPQTEAVFAEGVRAVTAADGTPMTVRLIRRVGRIGLTPAVAKRCNAWALQQLARRTKAERRARRLIAGRRTASPRIDAGPWLLLGARGGSSGGPFELGRFAEHGVFMSSGTFTRDNADGRPSSRLHGLVPDGVATVVLDFPRYAPRGPHRRARDYGEALQVTAPVKDNVVAVSVARDAGDAFAPTMTWLGPDGGVVRVVKPER